ncbi:CG7551 [Drosophila busckii]|uniref:CG7551 n=1 Tax=Drosophila busckii TaxID=30019 RepID=A0A0M4EIJ2_DROBS|nr:ketohexokinase [Drosophila busckii]ALC43701.1 CG7551 [Drosophila busckii]
MSKLGDKLSWAVGKKRVLCVGNCVIDCISMIDEFPKPDRPERTIRGYWQRGGNASNTCTVLSNLGIRTEFFGMLSSAPMFRMILDDMRHRGIKMDNCPRTNADPPFSSVILTRATRSCNIVNCSEAFPYVNSEQFAKLNLSDYGWIHFRGKEFKQTLEMMQAVESFNATSREKIIVSMDLDSSLNEMWQLVSLCDYVFFSKRLALERDWLNPKDACLNIDEKLRMRFGLNLKRPLVVFLWGKQGAAIMDQSGKYTRMPAYRPKPLRDALGAGDTFVAAFIYAVYARGRSTEIAVDFGNRMASHKCTKHGYDHIADILVAPVL